MKFKCFIFSFPDDSHLSTLGDRQIYRDVNVSYFLGFPIFSMLVLTHLFLNLKCDLKKKVFSAS